MTDTPASTPFVTAPQPPPLPPRAALDYTSLSVQKIALIAGLAVATILPNLLISSLVEERETRRDGVRQEFTRNWGPEQTIYAPTLVLPYQLGPDKPRIFLKIAPARLDLLANIAPQERKRGLFSATVYDAKLEMQGTFVLPAESHLRTFLTAQEGRFMWDAATLALGSATGLTGLRSSDRVVIDGSETSWQPCLEAMRQDSLCNNVAIVVAAAPLTPSASGARIAFKAGVTLRGTGAFGMHYAGKDLSATVRSSWPSPSFAGTTLPVSSTVTSEGFEANWQTTELGSPRVTASTGLVDVAMWKGPTIRVDLIEATPIYRMINRVAKYGLLFVLLSFATYFFFELMSRLRIHVVQYGLLALSLSLFSLLLLALAEPIGYTNGYLASAGLVLIQSTLYTGAVARRITPALVFAVMLASLFAFLYLLLGLETYSLLIGALALFVVVSVLMALTQMVDLPGRLSARAAG